MLSLTDEEIVERASRARNGARFRALWLGDTSGYPSHSDADAALVELLLFYGQGDEAAAGRLFRRSGLYRDKWEREDYRRRTFSYVLSHMTRFATPPPTAPSVVTTHNISPPEAEAGNREDEDPLLARIRALEAEVRWLREENERQRKQISAQAGVLRNPDLKPATKLVTIAVANEAGWRSSRGDLAPYVVNCGRLAEAVGLSRQAVSRHLDVLAADDDGLLEKRLTREELDDHSWRTVVEIAPRCEGGLVGLLLAAANYRPPEPEREPKTPPNCPDHPDAPLIERRITSCTECGLVLIDVWRVLFRRGPSPWRTTTTDPAASRRWAHAPPLML